MDSFDDSTKRNLNALLPLLEHPENIDDLQAMITDLELSEEKEGYDTFNGRRNARIRI